MCNCSINGLGETKGTAPSGGGGAFSNALNFVNNLAQAGTAIATALKPGYAPGTMVYTRGKTTVYKDKTLTQVHAIVEGGKQLCPIAQITTVLRGASPVMVGALNCGSGTVYVLMTSVTNVRPSGPAPSPSGPIVGPGGANPQQQLPDPGQPSQFDPNANAGGSGEMPKWLLPVGLAVIGGAFVLPKLMGGSGGRKRR